MAQMPEEGRKFGIVDSYWKDIMGEAVREYSVIALFFPPLVHDLLLSPPHNL